MGGFLAIVLAGLNWLIGRGKKQRLKMERRAGRDAARVEAFERERNREREARDVREEVGGLTPDELSDRLNNPPGSGGL